MPRGDRSEGHPNLGAFGVFIAIILCSVVVGFFSYSAGRESEGRDKAPASYSRSAEDDAKRSCVGMEAGAAFKCIYEKVEASQEQARGEQDLTAQQRSAFAAMISAFIAFLTLVATALGVWLVKRTLDATLEAVKDTSEATDAMRKANMIATATQRPIVQLNAESFSMFMHPKESRYNLGNTGPYEIKVESIAPSFQMRNYGNQPCWFENLWLGFFVYSGRDDNILPDQPLSFYHEKPGFVPPGGSIDFRGTMYRMPIEYLDLLNARPQGTIMFGASQYRDAAGNFFCSRFAYRIHVGSGSDALMPISIAGHWQDGRIKALKVLPNDPIEFIGVDNPK